MQLCSCAIHLLKSVSIESVDLLTAEDGLHQSACIKSHFFSPLFLSLSVPHYFLNLFSVHIILSFPTLCSPYPSAPFPFWISSAALSYVLSDHQWHQSNASLHLQPGPRAHGPRREAGWLLSGEGGVWGGETWRRTKTQGQESLCLTALPD